MPLLREIAETTAIAPPPVLAQGVDIAKQRDVLRVMFLESLKRE
jgi:hypothetical protein